MSITQGEHWLVFLLVLIAFIPSCSPLLFIPAIAPAPSAPVQFILMSRWSFLGLAPPCLGSHLRRPALSLAVGHVGLGLDELRKRRSRRSSKSSWYGATLLAPTVRTTQSGDWMSYYVAKALNRTPDGFCWSLGHALGTGAGATVPFSCSQWLDSAGRAQWVPQWLRSQKPSSWFQTTDWNKTVGLEQRGDYLQKHIGM